MLKETSKFENSNIFEGMPSISAVIKAIENNIGDRKILHVFVDNAKVSSKRREISFLNAKARTLGFDVSFVNSELIDHMSIGNTHGGIIAECTSKTIPSLTAEAIKPDGVYFMLEGIEDPYNFGNALRSIYASGADGIVVGERNWYGVAGTLARSSAGASELLNSYMADPVCAVNLFKAAGYRVICAGIRDSVSLFDADLSKPLFVILGGEKRGISRNILDLADDIVRIDYGIDFNGSLSASSSAAVFAFEILKYNKKS